MELIPFENAEAEENFSNQLFQSTNKNFSFDCKSGKVKF